MKRRTKKDGEKIEQTAEQFAHLMVAAIDEKAAKQKRKKEPAHKLSEETIKAAIGLGEVLRKIHTRLVAEGKVKVVNGKVVFIKEPST